MKLRNKKTGEIRKAEAREDGIYLWDELTEHWWKYGLELLASGWEYYIKPTEPLIKDEKIRKAVRAWAEANDLKNVAFVVYDDENVYFIDRDYEPEIWFPKKSILWNDLDDGKVYTIAELCGEDEE